MKLTALLKAALVLWDNDLGIALQVEDTTVRVAATDRYMLIVGSTGTPWDDAAPTAVLRDKKDVEDILRFAARHLDLTLHANTEQVTASSTYHRLTVPVTQGVVYPKINALLPTSDEEPADPRFVVDPRRLALAGKIGSLLTGLGDPLIVTPRGRKPALITDRGGDWTMLVMPIRE